MSKAVEADASTERLPDERLVELVVNGGVVSAPKSARECRGALVWFYLRNHGRFIFSLTPQDGYDFKKVGSNRAQ